MNLYELLFIVAYFYLICHHHTVFMLCMFYMYDRECAYVRASVDRHVNCVQH